MVGTISREQHMVSFKLRELFILTYLAILVGAMYLLPHPLVPISLELCPLLIWRIVHYSYFVVMGFVASGTILTQDFLWPIYLQVALVIAFQRFITHQNDIKTKAYRGH